MEYWLKNGLIRYLMFFPIFIKFFTFRTIPVSFGDLFYSNAFLMEPNNFAIFVVTLNHVVFIFSHSTKAPNILCIYYGLIFIFSEVF